LESAVLIIGLAGYARSGKDESAKALVSHGFERVAFADKMREFIYRLNPIVTSPVWGEHRRLADVIDEFGWDGYKETPYGKEMRELMQRLGTDCGRELISDSIWVDAALGTGLVAPRDLVVTDVRFPNEFDAIKARGGYVFRVVRPGVGPANSHPSETALDNASFDAVIENDRSIGELHDLMAGLAAGLR
jgi:hypothetical protein